MKKKIVRFGLILFGALFITGITTHCLFADAEKEPKKKWEIEIENRFGGNVYYRDEKTEQLIATVFRPLGGGGRWGKNPDPARIKSIQPDLLSVSATIKDEKTGFFIITDSQANTSNYSFIVTSAAYMVVGPVHPTDPDVSQTVLFSNLISPGDSVEVKVNGNWMSRPGNAAERSFDAIERVRIKPYVEPEGLPWIWIGTGLILLKLIIRI